MTKLLIAFINHSYDFEEEQRTAVDQTGRAPSEAGRRTAARHSTSARSRSRRVLVCGAGAGRSGAFCCRSSTGGLRRALGRIRSSRFPVGTGYTHAIDETT